MVALFLDPGSKKFYLSNAKIRFKIGQAVPEVLAKNATDFHKKMRKNTLEIGSVEYVFRPITLKHTENVDIVNAHIN